MRAMVGVKRWLARVRLIGWADLDAEEVVAMAGGMPVPTARRLLSDVGGLSGLVDAGPD
ncbi:MAG: hypothetical protein AAGA56_03925 [Myxococcota bacterium]